MTFGSKRRANVWRPAWVPREMLAWSKVQDQSSKQHHKFEPHATVSHARCEGGSEAKRKAANGEKSEIGKLAYRLLVMKQEREAATRSHSSAVADDRCAGAFAHPVGE